MACVHLFLTLISFVALSLAIRDPTDIPTCGYAPSWNCAPHPLVEPKAYCDALKTSSVGLLPVPHKKMESVFALMHYFFPGNNSYRVAPKFPIVSPVRDSWGYQYYSLEHASFRWDQIFALDMVYDASSSAKPGAQLFETARATDDLMIDINLPNGPDTGILDRDHRGGAGALPACAYIPPPYWKLMRSDDLYNKNITTYCGVTVFPHGFIQVGTSFDVYMMTNRWFPTPNIPIFWYINRENGEVAAQLYYQSISPNGSQNYFWDFSRKIVPDEIAKQMFRANPHYYFDVNMDMVKRGCPDSIYQTVKANQFPDGPCCGPSTNCVPCVN